MQRYVVGFVFDTFGRTALIQKNRPEWQAGRLNGIGGHVEEDEGIWDAMEREFFEETGVRLKDWELFAYMYFPGARIDFFRILDLDPKTMDLIRTVTDEEVIVRDAGYVLRHPKFYDLIPNLTWLIPLARYTADNYEPIEVRASVAEVLT